MFAQFGDTGIMVFHTLRRIAGRFRKLVPRLLVVVINFLFSL